MTSSKPGSKRVVTPSAKGKRGRPRKALAIPSDATSGPTSLPSNRTPAGRRQPASAEAQSNLGRVLYRKGALAESIDHLQRAMALNPAVPDIHNTLGLALEATGRQDDALREFEVAVRLKPDFAYAHLCIAQALLKQGRREDALPHLKEAVRLDPSLEPARRQLQSLER